MSWRLKRISTMAVTAMWLTRPCPVSRSRQIASPSNSSVCAAPMTKQAATKPAQTRLTLSRVSPNTLFSEATQALLTPETRTLGLVFYGQLQGAMSGAPLPLGQSLVLIWPHVTGLVAGAIGLFTLTYVLFQQREIRA